MVKFGLTSVWWAPAVHTPQMLEAAGTHGQYSRPDLQPPVLSIPSLRLSGHDVQTRGTSDYLSQVLSFRGLLLSLVVSTHHFPVPILQCMSLPFLPQNAKPFDEKKMLEGKIEASQQKEAENLIVRQKKKATKISTNSIDIISSVGEAENLIVRQNKKEM